MSKLVVGLAVGIAVLVLLVPIGLALLCTIRRRRRRKDKVATVHQGVDRTGGEGESPQSCFQQNVEFVDEQRRHEMETIEIRYELQGEDDIH